MTQNEKTHQKQEESYKRQATIACAAVTQNVDLMENWEQELKNDVYQ